MINVGSPCLNGNEKKYVMDCMASSWISSNGKYIEQFEKMFAEFVGAKHAIAVSNGTVALHLALLGLGIKLGDEIIMPTLSYIATANAATYCGAKTVFVDSEKETGNIDCDVIEDKITNKTKAILPVHLYGHSFDIDKVKKIAKKHNLFLIEDAAEAIGATYKGKHVGALCDVGIFSFFGNKIITTGEGGMVVTNDDELAKKMRLLKGQGMNPNKRYWHIVVGYNYRMTNIEAAIGVGQMEKIDWHLNRRQEIAKKYDELLSKHQDKLILPIQKSYAKHCYWMYTVILKDNSKVSRDEVMVKMAKKDIETRPVFYPMHSMPMYKRSDESFPVAENISKHGINLPSHANISFSDQEKIVKTLIESLS